MNNYRATFKAFAFFTGCLLATVPSLAAELDASPGGATQEWQIAYSVTLKGFKVGRIETQVLRTGDDYSIESITKPSGMAAMMLGGKVTDRCRYSLDQQKQVQGLSYSSEKEGKKGYNSHITYDRAASQLQFKSDKNAKKNKRMPKGLLLDNCNFYATISRLDREQLRQQSIHVLDARESRYRSYRFMAEESELIETSFGDLDTTKLTLVRDDNPERQLIFWLADEFRYSPVKIVEQRKSRKTLLQLIAYQGVASPVIGAGEGRAQAAKTP